MGSGKAIQRHEYYQIQLRCWLNKGDPVRWTKPWGLMDRAELKENNETLVTDVRIDRECLIPGLFYGVEGMHIGGMRKIKVAPHLAYGDDGVSDVIPPNSVLIFEVKILGQRYAT